MCEVATEDEFIETVDEFYEPVDIEVVDRLLAIIAVEHGQQPKHADMGWKAERGDEVMRRLRLRLGTDRPRHLRGDHLGQRSRDLMVVLTF